MYNRDLIESQMGFGGFEYISDTAEHKGDFVAIQVMAAATFSGLVANPAPTGNTFTGEAIPVGATIYGRFSSITLTSGKVIAYKSATL